MRFAIDTCVLICGSDDFAAAWLEKIRRTVDDQLLVDDPDGPCALEILKHSPSTKGKLYREELGYTGPTIPNSIYKVYIGLIKNSRKSRTVPKHRGEPSGVLKGELRAMVRRKSPPEKRMIEWWDSDRKWVSLCQSSAPADIVSLDNGFKVVRKVLKQHNIGVRDKPP